MSDPPVLDRVRRILAPLDLLPVFAVIGGDHLFGYAGPKSEVRVRAVHRSALAAGLGHGRATPSLELELLDEGLSVSVYSETPERAARRVGHGDGTFLEEIRSPLVVVGDEPLAALREASAPFLTRRLHRHYRSLARAALWRLEGETTKGRRALLELYRALLAGIRVLETGELVPDLPSLADFHGLPHVAALAAEEGPYVGDPTTAGFLLNDAYALLDRMDRALEITRLPEDGPPPDRLLAWAAAVRRAG